MAKLKSIKSSRHTTKYANTGKRTTLDSFLSEYRRMLQLCVDYIWDLKTTWNSTTKVGVITTHYYDLNQQQYDLPKYLSTVTFAPTTTLYARAMKCCMTQACGLVKAVLKLPARRQWRLAQLQAEGQYCSKLLKKIARTPLTKPLVGNCEAELNSICCDYQEAEGYFNGFLRLHSLGPDLGEICLPIKNHRQSNKFKAAGRLLTSFLVSRDSVSMRYELPVTPEKTGNTVMGIDQGYRKVVTLSTGTQSPKTDLHGHTLETITHKLARQRKGSVNFGQTQEHRKNFINWSVNSVVAELNTVDQVNFEEIININYGHSTSRLMSHWTNTLIRDKVSNTCKENGVRFVLQSSTYRSQRCFSCGWVSKANRKGEAFVCKSCGAALDADLNAAKNHTIELPTVSRALRKLQLNRKGFYWKPVGFYDCNGKELTVPSPQK